MMMHHTETGADQIAQALEILRAHKAAHPSPVPLIIVEPKPKSAPTRTPKRRPSIASVIRQMKRAGVEVAGCEVQRDGTVKIISGKPSDATTTDNNDSNEWDTLQ